MRSNAALLILGGIALAALASQSNAATNFWASGADPAPPLLPPPDQNAIDQAVSDTMNSPDPVSAFLAVIRKFESNNDYSILYGGGHITDFSRFPYTSAADAPIITMGQFAGQHSTAAGAYQINLRTYNDFATRLGITDFYPPSQDKLGLAILRDTGAYDAILAGDIESAFNLASKRWASMPASTAGQNPQRMATVVSWFDTFLTA